MTTTRQEQVFYADITRLADAAERIAVALEQQAATVEPDPAGRWPG